MSTVHCKRFRKRSPSTPFLLAGNASFGFSGSMSNSMSCARFTGLIKVLQFPASRAALKSFGSSVAWNIMITGVSNPVFPRILPASSMPFLPAAESFAIESESSMPQISLRLPELLLTTSIFPGFAFMRHCPDVAPLRGGGI